MSVSKKEDDDYEDILDGSTQEESSTDTIISTLKTSVFVFILFILLSSDVFIDRILSTSDNSYAEGRNCTTKGTIVQGLILSIGFILIHTLILNDYV